MLFVTLSKIDSLQTKGIYTDLLRQFAAEGHQVYVATPIERRFGEPTKYLICEDVKLLKISTLNITKTNVFEKGIGTLLLEYQFNRAIKKHLGEVAFDLVLYSTPPITLTAVIKGIKRRCNAISYLMLKDIFPQNAVDMGMFSRRSLFYKFFRHKEQMLYKTADFIGCMSPANCAYILSHNPTLPPQKVELCPNSLQITACESVDKLDVRQRYGLPIDKRIFIYGGNLGKPQGIDFLLRVLESNRHNGDVYFVVIGSGTEYHKIQTWYQQQHPQNVKLFESLPTVEYDRLVQSCDVGMIFLDARFTIPNYPSRLLSYIGHAMPVILATDSNTDVGTIATANGYGLWSLHGDLNSFNENLHLLISMSKDQLETMGNQGYRYFCAHYDVKQAYRTIVSHFMK
ncbi:MAG: glycosyltransferase family 4 protein [Alistipes sp.]